MDTHGGNSIQCYGVFVRLSWTLMDLESTQPLTEISTRNLPRGNGATGA
jgi:hypothetical protein